MRNYLTRNLKGLKNMTKYNLSREKQTELTNFIRIIPEDNFLGHSDAVQYFKPV